MKTCTKLRGWLVGVATLLLVASTGTSQAATLASHSGDTDPTTEGWSLTQTGTVSPAAIADTEAAWRIDDSDTGGRAFYRVDMSALDSLNARSGGWTLSGRVHVTDLNNPEDDTRVIRYSNEGLRAGDEEQLFVIALGSDGSGATVSLDGDGAAPVAVGSGFHDYDLAFDPATRSASLSIDNVASALSTAGTSGSNFTNSLTRFGSVMTPATGEANYSQVSLTTAEETGAILAGYDFEDGNATREMSIDADGDSTATNMTFNTAGGANTWGFSGTTDSAFTFADETADSEAGAVAADDYFTFTVTPVSGMQLNLDSVTLLGVGGNSGPFNTTWFVRSGVDSFATTLASETIAVGSVTTYESLTIDLSGSQFQGLDTIEFRAYNWDDSSSGFDYGRLDDVVLRGTVEPVAAVPVPEPSTLAIFAMGIVGLAFRGLRTRKCKVNRR